MLVPVNPFKSVSSHYLLTTSPAPPIQFRKKPSCLVGMMPSTLSSFLTNDLVFFSSLALPVSACLCVLQCVSLSLPKTNIAPENRQAFPKRKQSSNFHFFRGSGYVSFRESIPEEHYLIVRKWSLRRTVKKLFQFPNTFHIPQLQNDSNSELQILTHLHQQLFQLRNNPTVESKQVAKISQTWKHSPKAMWK